MIEEYKYYMFYKYSEDKDIFELYAYTTDRKIAKQFRYERKDIYKLKKMKLSRKEVNDLAREHKHSIINKITSRNKFGEEKRFLCTEDEFINISDYAAHKISRVSGTVMGDMRFIHILKEKYIDALAYLLYIKAYKLIKYGKTDFLFGQYDIDIVGTFISLYSKELSEECIGYLLFN